MRALISILGLCLLVAAANAETITISKSPCDQASYCSSVTNSAGDTLTIVYAKQYGRLSIIDNGVLWDSGIYALPRNGSDTLFSVQLNDGTGRIMYATLTFSGGQVTGPCHQNGRVCVFPHAPRYIDDGTLTL